MISPHVNIINIKVFAHIVIEQISSSTIELGIQLKVQCVTI